MKTLSLASNDHFIFHHQSGFLIVTKHHKFEAVCMKSLPLCTEIGRVGPNQKYEALEVFGVTIHGRTLEKLSTDLKKSNCSVNREGYSYLRERRSAGIRNVFKSERYLRLNDLFPWSQYGVTVPAITTVWNRMDHKIGKRLVNHEISSELLDRMQKKEKELSEFKSKVTSLEAEKMEVSNCKSKVTSLEAEVSKYKKELSDCMSKVTNLDAEVSKYKKELSEGEQKMSSLEIQVGKYMKELEEENMMIEEYKKGKQAEMESKQEELSTCKKDSEEKKKLLEAKSKEVHDLKAELSDTNEKLEKNKVEKDEELAKLRVQVLSEQKRNRDLKVAIDSLGIPFAVLNDLAGAA